MGRTARRGYDLQPGRDRAVAAHAELQGGLHHLAARRLPLRDPAGDPPDATRSSRPANAVRVGKLGGLGGAQRRGAVGPARRRRGRAGAGRRGRGVRTTRTAAVALLQELHAAPIRDDLLTEALRTVRRGRRDGRRAGEPAARPRAGARCCWPRASRSSSCRARSSRPSTSRRDEPLNLKDFIASLEFPVVAGGVGDYRTAMHLMRTGAAGVIVGYGESVGDDDGRGARHRRPDGHRDRRRRGRPARLPRRDRRPLRARHRGRRDRPLGRHGQGDRLRRGRGDARRAARRGRRRARPGPVLDLRGGAPVAAALAR